VFLNKLHIKRWHICESIAGHLSLYAYYPQYDRIILHSRRFKLF